MSKNLRNELVDAINELNKLIILASNEDNEAKLRKWRRIGFALLEEVVKQDIKSTTAQFREAIEGLQEAQEKIDEAKKDIAKVAEAINKFASAAKAVDKIVKLGINLLA